MNNISETVMAVGGGYILCTDNLVSAIKIDHVVSIDYSAVKGTGVIIASNGVKRDFICSMQAWGDFITSLLNE